MRKIHGDACFFESVLRVVKTYCFCESLLFLGFPAQMRGKKMEKTIVPCRTPPKSQNNPSGFANTGGKHMETQATTQAPPSAAPPRGRRPLGWVVACVSMCFPRVLVNPGGLFWLFGGVLQGTKGFLHILTTHLCRKT